MKSVLVFLLLGLLTGNVNALSLEEVLLGGPSVCIKLDSGTTCTRSTIPDSEQSDFTVTCGGVPVKGIGLAGPRPSSFNQPNETLVFKMGSGANSDDVCWCKILSPAVSQWIASSILAYNNGKSQYGAVNSCPHVCSAALVGYDTTTAATQLRQALLAGPFSE